LCSPARYIRDQSEMLQNFFGGNLQFYSTGYSAGPCQTSTY
jgi:hypothetical protein